MLKDLYILLVEDEESVAKLYKGWLEKHGGTVMIAGGMIDGLSKIRKKKAFDVILLDLYLPNGQGKEVIITFQKECPDVPIVVVSGHIYRELELESLRLGAQEVLLKGYFTDADMVTAIIHAIERLKFHKKSESITKILDKADQTINEMKKLTEKHKEINGAK